MKRQKERRKKSVFGQKDQRDLISRNEHEEFMALASSVDKLATNMENMLKEQERQGKRLETLEGCDGEMWRKVTEYIATAISDEQLDILIEAASNDLIGYDQDQRYVFWERLKVSGYLPPKITVACEADCSSGVAAIASGRRRTGTSTFQDKGGCRAEL